MTEKTTIIKNKKEGNGKAKVDLNNAIQQMNDNIEKLKVKRDEAFTVAEKEAIGERITKLIMSMSLMTKTKQKKKTIKNVTETLHKDIEDIVEEEPTIENIDRTKIGSYGISFSQPDLELNEQERKEVWDLIEGRK
jgi:hypothetical protein